MTHQLFYYRKLLRSGRPTSVIAMITMKIIFLFLEDYKKAMFLPGSNMEFFTLERYHEELGKDYKRITLFLGTLTDS